MTTEPTKAACVREYLSRQRWFAGKRRDFELVSIHALSWLGTAGSWPAVRIELVTVRYVDDVGGDEVYQLPLSYHREPDEGPTHAYVGQWASDELDVPVWTYDALHDKQATHCWLLGLRDDRRAEDLSFRQLDKIEVNADETSLVLQVEQSNTSLVFGHSVLLKVFRRVQHGRNPDIEVHQALTQSGCENVAQLYGWIEATWPDGDGVVGTGDLGMFSDFFRTASDGWELAITSVRDLYAEGDLHADEVGGDFAGESHRLGATTATIHAELAHLLQSDAWGPDRLRRIAAGMHDRLAKAVKAVPQLAEDAPALHTAYDALAALTEPVPVQRIHADLHLGQTMRTVGGWRVIDFEGEPARAFDERVALDSPIRDVAGMLRSFDYAAQHLLADHERLETVRPGTVPDDHEQLSYRAAEWAERNRSAFCAGYSEVAGRNPREQETLLRAYETDKAVYEVMYEARTRPDWLPIPLSATKRLAEATT